MVTPLKTTHGDNVKVTRPAGSVSTLVHCANHATLNGQRAPLYISNKYVLASPLQQSNSYSTPTFIFSIYYSKYHRLLNCISHFIRLNYFIRDTALARVSSKPFSRRVHSYSQLVTRSIVVSLTVFRVVIALTIFFPVSSKLFTPLPSACILSLASLRSLLLLPKCVLGRSKHYFIRALILSGDKLFA
jgi:hypothetical protein